MMVITLSRQAIKMPFVTAILSVLFLIAIGGCSGKNDPEQPFIIPFDSEYITTDKTLSVTPSLNYDGSTTRRFLSITQRTYFFENGNGTAEVKVLLNRKSEVQIPEIGEWNAVSTGNCFSDSEQVKCLTAHVDCHLVRTSFITTGERSIIVIKTRNRAREPQQLCDNWDLKNLTENQYEEVEEFNKISDSFFNYDIIIPQTDRAEQTNSTHKKRPSNQK
ncbi:hypothetical protein [Maridesulfovibrio ferrireducens]|nr:hypothetical protein [Maridesulfovibrio ferrireducens]